jgi:hypothetical protein
MTDTQLEQDCREWLKVDGISDADYERMITALATFVQQKVDEERKRCVEVVARNYSHEPAVYAYYTRLLSVEANTEEGKK